MIVINNLQFNEESLLTNNIFKYEQRLKSNSVNRFIENNAILTTYYNLNEDATTVDRGLQDIEQIFGKSSPMRYNKIDNFPLYGFDVANPNNTDEHQFEDITVEGDVTILPSTIVPHQYDIFTVNHLTMRAFFQVTDVIYDSMKTEGYYKIRYRLLSTSEETAENLKRQTVGNFKCDLKAIGSDKNPILKSDDFIRVSQISKMVDGMIDSYISLFYNSKHNCFLYRNRETGQRWFDLCGNEFMAKHSIMNHENSNNVISLHQKINEIDFQLYYNHSIYSWIERDAPLRFLESFDFYLIGTDYYKDSSFYMWSEDDIVIMRPRLMKCVNDNFELFFDQEQLNFFNDVCLINDNSYEMLIKKYIRGELHTIQDISLYTADDLIKNMKTKEVFLFTPIIIYIIRKVLKMT